MPSGLVSLELRFKYFSTMIQTVEAKFAEFQPEQLALCLEQFIPHLLDDMREFLQHDNKEHADFIASCLRILVNVNVTQHKFDLHRYVVFAIEAGSLVQAPYLRQRIVQTIVENKLISENRFTKH